MKPILHSVCTYVLCILYVTVIICAYVFISHVCDVSVVWWWTVTATCL